MSGQRERGRFPQGTSGNPNGRPRGTGQVAELREAIKEHVPAIVSALVTKAKGGDSGAARLLLERVVPALKPIEPSLPLALAGEGLTERGNAIFRALEQGDLSPSQTAQLLSALGHLAKATEVDELIKRVEALEKRHGQA